MSETKTQRKADPVQFNQFTESIKDKQFEAYFFLGRTQDNRDILANDSDEAEFALLMYKMLVAHPGFIRPLKFAIKEAQENGLKDRMDKAKDEMIEALKKGDTKKAGETISDVVQALAEKYGLSATVIGVEIETKEKESVES